MRSQLWHHWRYLTINKIWRRGGRRMKSCLCHHTRIYIIYKQVPGGEEEQADEMCKIIN
jgi:hypothetical protein